MSDFFAVNRSVEDRFRPRLSDRWRRMLIGEGRLVLQEEGLRLALPCASRASYSNAQIDDYGGLPRRRYPWRPPLTLTIRARFSGPPLGTAGFGFWNHPFVPTGGIPVPPRAIWFFFGGPPNDLQLASGVPGHGWKAGTIDALRPAALRWAPIAPLLVLLNRHPQLYRRIWPRIQRDLQVAEALVPGPCAEWREYRLEWRQEGARFAVDGQLVLETDRAPRGPLGFVAWMDNQWAIATPQGRLGFGLVGVDRPQWLDLAGVRIDAI